MALNFPSSPVDGQVFGDYTYNAAKGVWLVTEIIVPIVTTSDTPPASPKDGDMWMYTGDGTVFVYYQDVDGGQWIQTSGIGVEPKTDNLPAGSIIMWAAEVAPTNWLLCDGSVVNRADWPSLFATIGTTYNTGGESTSQFRLPNLKGRVAVGKDATQTEFDSLGETGGTKTHTLTEAQLPSHTHSSTLTNSTVASSSHRHDFRFSLLDSSYDASGPNAAMGTAGQAGAWRYSTSAWQGGTSDGSISTTFNSLTGAASGTGGRYTSTGDTNTPSATTTVGITNASSGSGEAHNNLQPYIVLNYIIKATSGVTAGDTNLESRVGSLETSLDSPIHLNGQTISSNYTIPVGYNGLSAGPITIADGVTVTIPDGSAWSVV